MLEIKKLLYVRNVEDFFGYKYLFQILVLGFLLFLSTRDDLQLRLMAHVFTLCWVSINSCQIYTLFKRGKCDFIFCESPKSEDARFLLFLCGSILENSIFGLFTFLFLVVFMHATILMAIIVTLLHFCFAISIGAFCGQFSNRFLGLIIIILFFMWNFVYSQSWTTDEFGRYISSTVQLYNIQKLNISNSVSLLIVTISLLLLARYIFGFYRKYRALKIMGIISLCTCCFIGIISYELTRNHNIEKSDFYTNTLDQKTVKWKGINEQSVTMFSGILIVMEEELTKLGMETTPYKEYEFNQYYVSYLNTLYQTRPIPIKIEKDSIYINIFSDAMINFDETYIIKDFTSRAYDQMQNQVINIDNKYVYQMVEGCREHVYQSVYENNDITCANDLIHQSNELIKRRNDATTTKSNFLKKIINIMYENDKEDIPKLYAYVQSELPKNNEEFIGILKEHFPTLLEDSNIKNIIDIITRGK